MAHLLVVDDSASMREMVEYALSSAGHDITCAVDGVQALEIARKLPFDLVVTDIHMPNMDGIELLRKLRATSTYQFIPILVLTTDSDESLKEEGKAAGATGWIVKPFNPEKLIQLINRVL